ncbi:MAG: hypothetical protein HYX42_06700 [Polaromonas sp.]|uniref:hypothetical protein n=1 Tax=Polaromonas sp. TaxID=1869339 RepID=UPI0025DB51C6|nr:hypothetical protein [Polaromonas sp.]MBI2725922.1 hypothetical protein [Polaromonas sp.]
MKTFFHSGAPASNMGFKVWCGIFLYAILAGLAIQLVILPYIFPQLHAGNGLLAGRDWVGFHAQAITEAQRITQGGWAEFRLRPDGDNAIIGLTGFFYVLFGPHPWALLPLSAAMFAAGGAALFSMIRNLGLEDNESIIAILPYLLFPSSLLQYGQIHKDVFCTATVLVILWAWSSLLSEKRQRRNVLPLLVVSAFALIILSVFRPYLMYPLLGIGVLLLVWYAMRTGWQFFRPQSPGNVVGRKERFRKNIGSVFILVVINACAYFMSISIVDVRMQPFPASDVNARMGLPDFRWTSNRDVRSADALRVFVAPPPKPVEIAAPEPVVEPIPPKPTEPEYPAKYVVYKVAYKKYQAYVEEVKKYQAYEESPEVKKYKAYVASPAYAAFLEAEAEAARIKAVQQCRAMMFIRDDAFFQNLVDRGFLKIAVARAGFTSSGGTTAASNIDKGIDFCKNEDLIRYIPRALQIAFFAPFPSKWLSVEKRNSSPIEIYISAVEMFYCYIAYLGLIYWAFNYRRWNVFLLLPMTFAFGLCLLLGLTVANVGTLYRMRFPFAMIFVSIGMAGILQLAKMRPFWVEGPDAADNAAEASRAAN